MIKYVYKVVHYSMKYRRLVYVKKTGAASLRVLVVNPFTLFQHRPNVSMINISGSLILLLYSSAKIIFLSKYGSDNFLKFDPPAMF